jgi:methyl-CpG-binding domain protein 4
MSTRTDIVPEGYRLVQEEYANDPWKVLVCATLVRRARGSVAKPIAVELFRRFPSPEDFLVLASDEEVYTLLKPLGFGVVRTQAIRTLSRAYSEAEDWHSFESVMKLPQVGNYAMESYCIFVLGMRYQEIAPEDHMLKYFLERERVDEIRHRGRRAS